MENKFLNLIRDFDGKAKDLLAADRWTVQSLPKLISQKGIYLFSENKKPLYVGRSNDLRKRLQIHCRPSSAYNQATFAFLIAREVTGNVKASYKQNNSRKKLLENDTFKKEFEQAKNRIREMEVRFIEESDPLRQALFEIYIAVELDTRYNKFENH